MEKAVATLERGLPAENFPMRGPWEVGRPVIGGSVATAMHPESVSRMHGATIRYRGAAGILACDELPVGRRLRGASKIPAASCRCRASRHHAVLLLASAQAVHQRRRADRAPVTRRWWRARSRRRTD